MHGQMKRRDVQVLRAAGHRQSKVSEVTGVAERSIRRIEREKPVTDFDDRSARKRSGVGRPSTVAAFASRIVAWLAAEPALASLELLRRAREDGYYGGKTQFYEFVRTLRPKDV